MLSPARDQATAATPTADTVATPPPTYHMAMADALRAFAILAVVFHHVLMFARIGVGGRVLNFGFLGVWGIAVFFVLSGFLLGKEFLRSILDDKPFPSVRAFLARRFLRIYPLYAVCIAASAVFAAFFLQPVPATVILQYAFMVQGTSAYAISALNGPLWTMGVDAAFYLVLPLFMGAVYTATRNRSRSAKIAIIAAALGAVALVSIVYRFYESARHPEVLGDFATAVVDVRNAFGMATAFAIGIGIAVATLVMPRERFTARAYAAMVVAGCAIAAAVPLAFRPGATDAADLRAITRMALIDPIAAISAGLIFYGLIQGGVPFLTRVARAEIVSSVAALSYAIYLFHFPVLEAFEQRILHDANGFGTFFALVACGIVVVLPVALLTHRFVEQPFLTIKDRLRPRVAS
jgi:peptidoglycan/LPS O-acetylase OafA/YrhL